MVEAMNSAILMFETPYGSRYGVREDGAIIRGDGQWDGSKDWLFLGLQNVKTREFIPFLELTQEKINSLQLKFKNGKPQYTVRDLDHGTVRVWGNTDYHGVAFISRRKVNG